MLQENILKFPSGLSSPDKTLILVNSSLSIKYLVPKSFIENFFIYLIKPSLIINYLEPRSFIEKIHVRGIWGNKLEIVDE